jgi:hypothetical protein
VAGRSKTSDRFVEQPLADACAAAVGKDVERQQLGGLDERERQVRVAFGRDEDEAVRLRLAEQLLPVRGAIVDRDPLVEVVVREDPAESVAPAGDLDLGDRGRVGRTRIADGRS